MFIGFAISLLINFLFFPTYYAGKEILPAITKSNWIIPRLIPSTAKGCSTAGSSRPRPVGGGGITTPPSNQSTQIYPHDTSAELRLTNKKKKETATL